MPFGHDCEYPDFKACVADNQDKANPEGYCATLMEATEGHCRSRGVIMRENKRREKIIRAETWVLDADGGRIQAVVSTEAKDRDGDIIRVSGWNMEHFMAHPVLLSSHNYLQLRNQIGHWESMQVRGKKLEGEAVYYIGEGNQEADWGFKLAQKQMAAYSVGFIPDMSKAKELESDGWMPSFEFNGQELLEVSQVTIPSNPQALQRVKGLHPVIEEIVKEFGDDLVADQEWTIDYEAIADMVVVRMQPLLAELAEELKATLTPPRKADGEGKDTHPSSLRDLVEKAIQEVYA